MIQVSNQQWWFIFNMWKIYEDVISPYIYCKYLFYHSNTNILFYHSKQIHCNISKLGIILFYQSKKQTGELWLLWLS